MPNPSRPRPALHFTPANGWMNDPHGVVHVDGEYHMYFQYVPRAAAWEPGIHWGHAVSTDLVTWREADVALAPLPGEVGCWSGSVVLDDGVPVMFYTSPTEGDWGRGVIVAAQATSGMDVWERTPAGALIDGPPEGQDFIEFRDPHVRRADGRWAMLLGAGVRDVGGCVLQYSSEDLQGWTFDGVLAVQPPPGSAPIPKGTIWECPQLVEVDGQWVLLVSAEDWQGVSEVIHAIGDYDGRQFTARHWGRFGHTRIAYATTTFRDAQDRPCAISWLRETHDRAPEGSAWAGAQSLVHVLRIVDDRLVVEQHPALADHIPGAITVALPEAATHEFLLDGGAPWRISLDVAQARAGELVLDVEGNSAAWSLRADLAAGRLVISTPSGTVVDSPLRTEQDHARLDLVVDAELAEVTWSAGEGLHVAHVPAIRDARVTVHRHAEPLCGAVAASALASIPPPRST